MSETLCRHCNQKKANRPRRLCWTCYRLHRDLYPIDSKYAPWGRLTEHEPTEAELDALIAQQRANLPDWWHTSEAWIGDR